MHDLTNEICHRCGTLLHPGSGDSYLVRIEAFADPSAPELSMEDSEQNGADSAAEWERLVAEMRELSERELMDQVFRRLSLRLCTACYRQWIENPTG